MRQIVVTLIAVVSFIAALAQWLDAQNGNSAFVLTVSSKTSAPGKAPEGMVWIPGGEFSMGAVVSGAGNPEMPMASNDSEPVHRVHVDGSGWNCQWRSCVKGANWRHPLGPQSDIKRKGKYPCPGSGRSWPAKVKTP